jgi:transposase
MPRQAQPIALRQADRLELQRWVAAHGTPQQVAQRCHIILSAAEGQPDKTIAAGLQINFKTVALWRARFRSEGTDCLWEVAAGRGRKPHYSDEKIKAIINATLQTRPAGATHWSCRTLAEQQGVSKDTINRVWQSHQLKPHLQTTFKLSRDAKFLEKLTDVVGLYLNPPEKALVLCVDEKSQIQALDRTQPGLPLKKGRCGTMTHDYKRNGTTTLFAALEVAQGKSGRSVLRPASQSGVFEISATFGSRVSRRYIAASGDGQLRYSQTPQCSGLVEEASAFPASLCSDQLQLVKSGGAVV